MTKTCPVCGTLFHRRPNEKPAVFRDRMCCTRTCAGKHNRPRDPDPTRHCNHCGTALIRRENERPNKFRKRLYCDRQCSEASRATNPTRTRGRAGQRSDRDVHFSRDSLMPTSIEELGRKREYPRVQPLGEPCPVHPSSTIGAWGKCPACESGNRWSKQQRETAFRPHHEGGR